MTSAVITWYCACRLCCGHDACGITASGVPPVEGVTAAANGYPFGTRVHIDGVGVRVIQYRMHRRYGPDRIDVYVRDHNRAKALGLTRRNIRILK